MRLFYFLLLAFVFVSASTLGADGTRLSRILDVLQQLDSKLVQAKTDSINNAASREKQGLGIPEGEMLFLSTFIKGNNYLGEVVAVKSQKGAWFDLVSFFENVGFAIDVNSMQATGWFSDPSKQFTFDFTLLNGESDAQKITLQGSDLYLDNGDIFVSYSVLAQWFSLTIDVDYSIQEMYIESKYVLPIEAKIDRLNRQAGQVALLGKSVMPWKPSPYQGFSSPLADVQFRYTKRNAEDITSYSILGAQDLAFFRSEYFISGKEGDFFHQSRVSLSREDTQGGLLGQLEATRLDIGDVLPTVVGKSGAQYTYARGARVSNYDLGNVKDTNVTIISGSVQSGWDVELYHNGVLIEQLIDHSEGQYLFTDIPLLYGNNEFEVIMYGPQGQVERRTEQYIIDGNALKGNQSFYDLSITQQGHRLIDSDKYKVAENGWQLAGRFETGLSDQLSIFGAGSMTDGSGGENLHNVALGANMNLANRALITVDAQSSSDKEHRVSASLRSNLAQQSLRFLADYFSSPNLRDLNNPNNYIRKKVGLELTGELFNNRFGRLSHQSGLFYFREEGESKQRISQTLNYANGVFGWGNQITWVSNEDGEKSSAGVARVQSRYGRIFGRLSMGYQIEPQGKVRDYNFELNTNLSEQWQLQTGIKNTLDDDNLEGSLSLNWQSDELSINSSVKFDNNDEWQLGLSGRMSLGASKFGLPYFMSRRGLAGYGTAMVRVFLDENNNGIFDENERPLKGVRIHAVQAHRFASSDERGIALLSSMIANRRTDILIDKDSIDDPFIVPAGDGLSITPRSGYVEYIDFPLLNASEIEGNIYIENGKVLPYAKVKLVNEQGVKVAQTKAAYDGYYLFTNLRPGKYQAELEQKQVKSKNLKVNEKITVELPVYGEVVTGVDFSLAELKKTEGYTASLGKFSSLKTLKVYLMMTKEKLISANILSPFYIFDELEKKYILAVGFSKNTTDELRNKCEQVRDKGLPCDLDSTLIRH
jgi:hypothetical protein